MEPFKKQQNVSFESSKGHQIAGVIHFPDDGKAHAYALFAHCFTCTKNINSAVNIVNALAEEGIATLRFDFTGLGASSGEFADTNFSSDVQDLIDAAQFLSEKYQAPQILVGHSLGGTATLAAAPSIPSAKAVATIGSPSSPEHILHHLEQQLETIKEEGEAVVDLAGRAFKFKQAFVDDVKQAQLDIHGLGKALMVLHSPIDDTVSIDEAAKIYTQALHPKSFITLDNANHLLTNSEDSRYAGKVLAAWARRYIELPELKKVFPSRKTDTVVVSADTEQGFLNLINANGHQIIADEPATHGGGNLGATPYDFLATALGTCTAMTLNMYARHKKLPVTNVTVDVMHHKIHADDCDKCASENAHKNGGKVDVFERTISIEGDLSKQQHKRMLEIADRCPVHKTLHGQISIKTKLK